MKDETAAALQPQRMSFSEVRVYRATDGTVFDNETACRDYIGRKYLLELWEQFWVGVHGERRSVEPALNFDEFMLFVDRHYSDLAEHFGFKRKA